MATADDFSFPAYKSSFSIDSPPLWHLSPAAEDRNRRQEIVSVVTRMDRERGDDHDREQDQENKMDMLWEDFNEEVIMSRATVLSDYSGPLSREMMQLGCVNRALRWSKANGGGDVISTARKPSLVAMIKVLKRLFFLHNNSSHHKLKQPAW